MNSEQVKELAAKIVEHMKETIADIKSWQGIGSLKKVTANAVEAVEEVGALQGLDGSQKRLLALEVILSFVKLPFWIPRPLAALIINMIIDWSVKKFNELRDEKK